MMRKDGSLIGCLVYVCAYFFFSTAVFGSFVFIAPHEKKISTLLHVTLDAKEESNTISTYGSVGARLFIIFICKNM